MADWPGSDYSHSTKGILFMLGTILLVLLVLMLIGALPAWPHSRSWGYYPSGGLGLLAVILIVVLLWGRF
jgi:asparagine N-glycosylation enzyme membrane subunit Stt3